MEGRYVTAFCYEFIGTCVLTWAVIVSGGNPFAVAFTLLALMMWAIPLTGAHFNPCQWTAAYVLFDKKTCETTLMYLTVMAAQFLGALAAVPLSSLILMGNKENVPLQWVPVLCSNGWVVASDAPSTCDLSQGRENALFI